MSYRPDLDGLRALAILLVVGYHIGIHGLSGGFVGVDVFFVLSGFLITSLLLAELESSSKLDFRAFYARRVRRLLPALIVVLIAVAVTGWFVLTPVTEQQELARSLLATATLVVNFYFRATTDGYFAASADRQPLLNMWTLAVEEQFYLLWPLFLLLAWQASPRGQWTRMRILFGITFAISLAGSALLTPTHPAAAFYLLPTRTWEFAAGALIAAAPGAGMRVTRVTGTLLSVAGLAMVVAASVGFSEQTEIPGIATALPVLGTCMLIAAGGLRGDNAVSRLLSARPVAAFGSRLSYSLYLWHWPCLVFVRAHALGERDLVRDSLVGAFAAGLAWITYVWIEQPARTRRWRPFATERATLLSGAAISLCVVAAAGALSAGAERELHHSVRYTQLVQAMQDVPSGSQSCHEHFPFSGPLPDKARCTLGAANAPLLLLWGDSHANQLQPMLARFAQLQGMRLLQRSMSSCPPLLGVTPRTAVGPIEGCSAFNDAVLHEIRHEMDGGRVGIVLAAFWPVYLGERSLDPSDRRVTFIDGAVADPAEAQRVFQVRLEDTIHSLQGPDVRIVVVEPIPQMRYNVPICLAGHSAAECSVSRLLVNDVADPARKVLQASTQGLRDVRLWDSSDFFCDPTLCRPRRGSLILYRDNNHLTASAAAALEPDARSVLQWASFRTD